MQTRTPQLKVDSYRDPGLTDPGYEHPGYIDVLVPYTPNSEGAEDRGPRLRRPLTSTPSYPIEQCDRERWITIATTGGGATACTYGYSSETRKRPFCQDTEHLSGSYDGCCITGQEATWDAFQHYLDRCVPVKIKNVALFRDATPAHQSDQNDDSRMQILPPNISALPPPILDTTLTVQCAFLPRVESTIFPSSPQEIDNAISLSTKNAAANKFPTFMGQEDQITTEMTLRDVIHWSSNSEMSVCVAQVPIATTNEESDDGKTINLNLDGRLQQSTATRDAMDDTQMSQLSSMLHLPSYLLIGDPREIVKDGCGGIVIRNINLWHAPQTCCTNVHYDDHDNLLIVAEGVKAVELSPPGCIRGSGIYSEHANHPALLRRNVQNDDENNSTDGNIRTEIETTRDQKRLRTHLISVSAGEALYIPRGWWHRVESTSSSGRLTNRGCTAVNIWFDYEGRTDAPSKHMVPFHLRDSARKRYVMHAEHAGVAALEAQRQIAMGRVDGKVPVELRCSHIVRRGLELGWALLRGVDPAAEKDMRAFGGTFSECWAQFTKEVDTIEVADRGLICEIVDQFRIQLEIYLLLLNLGNDLHIEALVNLWTLLTPPSPSGHANISPFSELILGMNRESCYIVTQAWERREAKSEVESSFKHFFELVGDENEKKVRTYLAVRLEEFRRKSCESYYSSAGIARCEHE